MARILVVDDERYVLNVLATLLGRMGHECVSTTSPREALQIAEAYRPDLLVVDVTMAEMAGAELVRALHRLPGGARPPVVFVSGYAESGIEPSAELRMRFVAKPFAVSDLAEAVGALLAA